MGSDTVFVNVYEVQRVFGGHEEGGWWYDEGTVLLAVPCPDRAAAEVVKGIIDKSGWYSNQGRPPLWSVTADSVFRIHISDKAGADFPAERMVYE